MTEEQPGLELAEAVAQRICHDLAGPIGALTTAVDLLDMDDDVVLHELIADSIAALAASLKLHRFVFGPGRETSATGAVRELFAAWALTRQALVVDWSVTDEELPGRQLRLLLGLAIVAAEAAHRGGRVCVASRGVTAIAPGILLDPALAAVLTGGPVYPGAAFATPRLVAALAAAEQLTIEVTAAEGIVTLTF